jgi:hypothetical protein
MYKLAQTICKICNREVLKAYVNSANPGCFPLYLNHK